MDWAGLDSELAVEGTGVFVEDLGDGAEIRWLEEGNRVAGEARIRVLEDNRVEWERFWVDFQPPKRGFYSKALALQLGWFKDHGLGPSVIRRNAQDGAFYVRAGFVDGDDPIYIVQDDEKSLEWLNRTEDN